jgi:hypothetical protein
MTRASDAAFELVAGIGRRLSWPKWSQPRWPWCWWRRRRHYVDAVASPSRNRRRRAVVLTRRSWGSASAGADRLAAGATPVLQQSLGAIKGRQVSGRQPFFEEQFRHVQARLVADQAAPVVVGQHRPARRRNHAGAGNMLLVVISSMMLPRLAQHRVGAGTVRLTGFRGHPVGRPHIMMSVGYLRESTSVE